MNKIIKIKSLGRQPYQTVLQNLKNFTHNRNQDTIDEIWYLEHDPVYTLGQAAKSEHLLNPGAIPIVISDRGGQVTYHGPGQLIIYCLIDLHRKKINIRDFICNLEKSIIDLLATYNIQAKTKEGAPGVYIADAKICSLGLRVRHGRTYHGLSLNVDMDLEPFTRINPCGFAGMQMTQIKDFSQKVSMSQVSKNLIAILTNKFGYEEVVHG